MMGFYLSVKYKIRFISLPIKTVLQQIRNHFQLLKDFQHHLFHRLFSTKMKIRISGWGKNQKKSNMAIWEQIQRIFGLNQHLGV